MTFDECSVAFEVLLKHRVVGLLTSCWGDGKNGGPNVPNYPLHGAAEVINPVQEYTYRIMKALYAEIVQDFPDEYVHLGLDEAYHACWLVILALRLELVIA